MSQIVKKKYENRFLPQEVGQKPAFDRVKTHMQRLLMEDSQKFSNKFLIIMTEYIDFWNS